VQLPVHRDAGAAFAEPSGHPIDLRADEHSTPKLRCVDVVAVDLEARPAFAEPSGHPIDLRADEHSAAEFRRIDVAAFNR
jgi:hypothetical protein